jgi:proteasome lid subunit RPN8/RPN11
MSRRATERARPSVAIGSDVVRQIRRHARSSIKTEVCGVLVGHESSDGMEVEACISGLNAEQAGAHVTFTQDTWEHIYKVKDQQYPNQRIVGWYHSHPGFGIFLSDHDTFIHKNFFCSPKQVAWVCDPHSDEEGCFGWVNGRIERLTQIQIVDRQGGETAEVGGRPEPAFDTQEQDEPRAGQTWRPEGNESEISLGQWTATILSYMSVLALGFVISWFFFPRDRYFAVPFDPATGHPLGPAVEIERRLVAPQGDPGASAKSPSQPQGTDPGKGGHDQRQ